tara:strand:+ start:414 stop:614 length:201 start_codon:yes stop_codon:yes gene_type:complete
MISTAKIVRDAGLISDSEEYVEVQFDDGTFVALSEEELRNAAALTEKGRLTHEEWWGIHCVRDLRR